MRPIDADAFREHCQNIIKEESNNPALISWTFAYDNMIDEINEQPTIEATPVEYAHWYIIEPEYIPEYITCSNCKQSYYTGMTTAEQAKQFIESDNAYNYCPNCGRKMKKNDAD